MYRIWLIVIAVIVYGCLYPWEFHSTPLPASPLCVLIHAWPSAIDRDVIQDIAVKKGSSHTERFERVWFECLVFAYWGWGYLAVQDQRTRPPRRSARLEDMYQLQVPPNGTHASLVFFFYTSSK